MIGLKNLSGVINVLTILAGAGLAAVPAMSYAGNENLTEAEDIDKVAHDTPATAPFGIGGLGVAPLVMMTVGREHGLFSEAYTDYTDIDGDGKLDIMFDPSIEYYGLYNNQLCYSYEHSTSGLQNAPSDKNFTGYWYPVKRAKLKSGALEMWGGETRSVRVCPGNAWSGNFLNYVTSSRIDVIRKVLYGGTRVYSTNAAADLLANKYKTTRYKETNSALLKHSRVLRDAHTWGKVLGDKMYGGVFTVHDFTPMDGTGNSNQAWFFAVASPDKPADRWTSSFMRFALVDNAAMPGVESGKSPNYLWDWVSRESEDFDSENSMASKNQLRIDRSKKGEGAQVMKGKSLFVGGASGVTTTNVAVVVCTDEFHDNDSCKNYGTEAKPIWQPVGLLQQYGEGESPRMKFGLMSGSWQNSRKGGTLRANIGEFNKEVLTKAEAADQKTAHQAGDFDFSKIACTNKKALCGIIPTFDRLGIIAKNDGYDIYGSSANSNGDHCARNPIRLQEMSKEQNSPLCADWGNPVGELLYQTSLYFRNMNMKNTETDMEERVLNIGHVKPKDPYPDGSSTYCAKPVSLVLADENISFDSTESGSDAYGGDASAIIAETRSVSQEYGLKPGTYYMGGVRDKDSGPYEFLPSRKEISDLSQVVGIAPAAAFSYGSYNVAGVASLYSKNLRETKGPKGSRSTQYMSTYVVAMQPNVPQINIDVNGSKVEILPFCKSVADPDDDRVKSKAAMGVTKEGGLRYVQLNKASRNTRIVQSTNQVADFYVMSLNDTEGEFIINYEDWEYGSDYDMDWVVNYKYQVLQGASGAWYVRVQLSHYDGDPYAPQHAGYVITGVEHEGVYVDLGKYSSKDTLTSPYPSNIYELDNVISDAAIIECAINKGHKDLASFIKSNKSQTNTHGQNLASCVMPRKAFTEDDYVSAFWDSGSIDGYYNDLVKKNEDVYYANRTTLFKEHSKLFASWEDFKVSNKVHNFRLLGDHFSSAGGAGGYTSSRVFKVSPSTAGSGWLKTPLWFAAKYGINSSYSLARGRPEVEPDNYYLVTNPIKLRDGIAEMLNKIDQSFKTGSSFVTEGSQLSAGGAVYGSNYDPSTWYGGLVKTHYDSSYQYTDQYDWNAAETFAATSPEDRLIMTMDYVGNKLVRLYAEDMDYDGSSTTGAADYAASAESRGVAAYSGYNIVRKLVDENVSDDDLKNDPDYFVFADKLVRWMLGEHKYEGLNTSENVSKRIAKNENKPLRYRAEALGGKEPLEFVLGDIVNSDAAVFTPGEDGQKFIAVGANDGMLHILSETDGTPVVSYVPSVMLSSLGRLVRETYAADHYPFVDSTPVFFKDRNTGKSYLYGTYGMGFKGGYVLNVTGLGDLAGKSPEEKFNSLNESAANPLLLWELTEKQTVKNADNEEVITMGSEFIGKQRTAPILVQTPKEYGTDYPATPYLLYSSGYDAERQGIVTVDMLYKGDHDCGGGSAATFTPCIVNEVEVTAEDPWGYGRTNALSPLTTYTETPIDEYATEMQGYVYRALYWGDLFGNVWKIDLDSLDAASSGDYYDVTNWGVKGDSVPQVIFRAVDGNEVAQPITTKIAVGFNSSGGIGLLFGTGAMWSKADQDPVSQDYNQNQTLYMIRDFATSDPEVNASGEKPVVRCPAPSMVTSPQNRCLVRLVESMEVSGADSVKISAEVDPSIDLTNAKQFGWYLDVLAPDGEGLTPEYSGARIYRDVNIVDGTWFSVPVNIPNVDNVCGGGGTSYILSGNWVFRNNQVDLESERVNDFLLGEGKTYVDAEGNIRTVYGGDKASAGGPTSQDDVTHISKVYKNSSWQWVF